MGNTSKDVPNLAIRRRTQGRRREARRRPQGSEEGPEARHGVAHRAHNPGSLREREPQEARNLLLRHRTTGQGVEVVHRDNIGAIPPEGAAPASAVLSGLDEVLDDLVGGGVSHACIGVVPGPVPEQRPEEVRLAHARRAAQHEKTRSAQAPGGHRPGESEGSSGARGRNEAVEAQVHRPPLAWRGYRAAPPGWTSRAADYPGGLLDPRPGITYFLREPFHNLGLLSLAEGGEQVAGRIDDHIGTRLVVLVAIGTEL